MENGQDIRNVGQTEEKPYVPRPRWQVWGARLLLAVFLFLLVLYYLKIAGG